MDTQWLEVRELLSDQHAYHARMGGTSSAHIASVLYIVQMVVEIMQ